MAMWTQASLHPAPASARIRLGKGEKGVQITKRGTVTIYPVARGTLVVDCLRWELPGLDEPERPRRYLARMLTNLGVPLGRGISKGLSEDHESAAERRERGHF